MSPKQTIYREMLEQGLSHIRNVQSRGFWTRARDRTSYQLAELLHNLPVSLFDEEIVEHDIWFLNHQARRYLVDAPSGDHARDRMADFIKRLFDVVPEGLRGELQWGGP